MAIHDIYHTPSDPLSAKTLVLQPTLSALESALTFDDMVLYAALHESIYCQGVASNWGRLKVRSLSPLVSFTPRDFALSSHPNILETC